MTKDLQKIVAKLMTLDLFTLGKEEKKQKLPMSRKIFREFDMEETKDFIMKEIKDESRKSKNIAKRIVKKKNDKTREKELWRDLLIGVSQSLNRYEVERLRNWLERRFQFNKK